MHQTTSKDGQMSAADAVREPRDDRRDTATAQRLCALTRSERPTSELIRFVAGPDERIYLDLARKLPGRGVWITADRASVAAAVKSGAFARSLKRKVNVSPDLPDETEKQLRRRLTEALSLANKAGLLVTGFDKVTTVIERGQACALLHGSDAATGGRQKLDLKLHALNRAGIGSTVIIECLTIDELSLAIGRPNVVHAALKGGGAAERFVNEADRLARYARGLEAVAKTAASDRPDDRPAHLVPSAEEAPS